MSMTADAPVVTRHYIELARPEGSGPVADLERLVAGLDAAGLGRPDVPLSVAAALPVVLRDGGFRVTVCISHEPVPRLAGVWPGDVSAQNYGLAIDLGTTNVVGRLVELDTGRPLAESSRVNPQIAHGDDVLTRIHYCLKPGRLDELKSEAASCINELAAALSHAAGIQPSDICAVTVSGNTTMAHLFLGLDPYGICRAPYTPVANRFAAYPARLLGLSVCPEAPVHVLPNVGSYVGGDVVAGILVSGMHTREEMSILVDVGTNAETVIGNRDWLLVCAGAAGPALEGGVVRFGMRAMPGAIERVRVDGDTLEPEYSVIGGVNGEKARGLCGSALIDLLAELFTTGIIDGRGKFVTPAATRRVALHENVAAYTVVDAKDSAEGVDIVFTEKDIDNLIRTKAAMYTVLHVVTRELGLSFAELAGFFIAGTFGAYISAEKAVTIGMVPDIDIGRYKLLGNSSLAGAAKALVSRAAMAELYVIADAITYKEMNVSSEFMTEFRAAMFLPHTDSSLFPSLSRAHRNNG